LRTRTTGEFEDANRNVGTAGAGDDTITLTFGTLRLAARNGKGGPKAAFAIRRGKAKTVTVSLPAGASLGRRRTLVRLVAVERGRRGTVTTVAFASA
jgi:hypothetical protein